MWWLLVVLALISAMVTVSFIRADVNLRRLIREQRAEPTSTTGGDPS